MVIDSLPRGRGSTNGYGEGQQSGGLGDMRGETTEAILKEQERVMAGKIFPSQRLSVFFPRSDSVCLN